MPIFSLCPVCPAKKSLQTGNPPPTYMPTQSSVIAAARRRLFPKKHLNLVFRIGLFLALAVALYFELESRKNLATLYEVFVQQFSTANWVLLAAVLLLMPFNWLFETLKWQPFLRSYEPLSLSRAYYAVLSGISFALFTPNRMGEYAGRLLFVRPENHWKSLLVNAVGGVAQYLILLTGGVLGGLWFASAFLNWTESDVQTVTTFALLGLGILYYIFFNIRQIVPIARRIPWLRRLKPYLRDVALLEQFRRRDLLLLLLWSTVRYAIYSTQYVLLLHFFSIQAGFWGAYAGVATIYLLQTIVPLPAVAGLMVRGNLAVFVWSFFGGNELGSLAATFILWIINLILPALVGTFSLFHVNITKTLGYEDD